MRIQTSALPEYCRWCSGRIATPGERYWLAVAQGYLGPYCSREHLNFAASAKRLDAAEDSANCLAERDEAHPALGDAGTTGVDGRGPAHRANDERPTHERIAEKAFQRSEND